MNEGIIKGSIGDLIFRIETLSSDRDTIKVCVRAAVELANLVEQGKTITKLREQLAAKDEALAAAQHTVTVYALAARAIALWTDKYCDKDLPYDEMIAQAVRDMAKDLEAKDEALSATIVYMKLKMKEPYTQVEIDTLQAAIDAHDALATPAKPSGAGATPMTSPTKEGA